MAPSSSMKRQGRGDNVHEWRYLSVGREGAGHQLRAAGDAERAVELPRGGVDGAEGQAEGGGDLLLRAAREHVRQERAQAWRQGSPQLFGWIALAPQAAHALPVGFEERPAPV